MFYYSDSAVLMEMKFQLDAQGKILKNITQGSLSKIQINDCWSSWSFTVSLFDFVSPFFGVLALVFGASSLYWPHEVEKNVSEQEIHERIKGFAITAVVCGIIQFLLSVWTIGVKLREQNKVHTT